MQVHLYHSELVWKQSWKEWLKWASLNKWKSPQTGWTPSRVLKKKSTGAGLDPKDFNDNIKREHDQIPKREETMSEMAGAKLFRKLDASHRFWQLRLDPESRRYTIFNTPFGRYCFLRVPFGIKSTPEIFHRAIESITEGLEETRAYIDDVVVLGKCSPATWWEVGETLTESQKAWTKTRAGYRTSVLLWHQPKCFSRTEFWNKPRLLVPSYGTLKLIMCPQTGFTCLRCDWELSRTG